MKNLYILSVLSFTVMIANNPAFAQKGKKEWIKLFDDSTTAGWHTYGKTTAGNSWKIENSALHLDPKSPEAERGDLVTNNEYRNFHLKLEWKVAAKSNSGIIFYVHEDQVKYHQTYSTGLEMQVLDNDGHPDGKILKHRSGDLYDLVQSSSEPVKPVGEWNKAEIISVNGQLTLKLNDVTVVNTTLWDNHFKTLLENSKFAKWQGFATYKSGKIALQDHGDEVWYRNIQIKVL